MLLVLAACLVVGEMYIVYLKEFLALNNQMQHLN